MAETQLIYLRGTQGEVSLTLPYPYSPHHRPSQGQILKLTPTNKIYTASLTGGNFLDKQTIVRTYRLSVDEADDLMEFLNVTCEEWIKSFTLFDSIDEEFINNVYADRSKFSGFRPFSNSFFYATLNFQVSIS